jgi:hypothetical protein
MSPPILLPKQMNLNFQLLPFTIKIDYTRYSVYEQNTGDGVFTVLPYPPVSDLPSLSPGHIPHI